MSSLHRISLSTNTTYPSHNLPPHHRRNNIRNNLHLPKRPSRKSLNFSSSAVSTHLHQESTFKEQTTEPALHELLHLQQDHTSLTQTTHEPAPELHIQHTASLRPGTEEAAVPAPPELHIEEKTYESPLLEAPELQEPEEEKEEPEFSEEDPRPMSQIWKAIQGCNNWGGMLEPMNSHLRREIIRYGEFAQACYDCFDFDPHSKYCGSSKYQGHHFFDKLDMGRCGYEVTRFLYATSDINLPNFFQEKKLTSVWSTHANWMGYVAVCTDPDEIARLGRRDILIAWRGTVTYLEWITDLKDILRPAHFRDDPSVKLELGFYELYTKKEENCAYCAFSAREQVLAEIKRLVDYYRGEEISITVTGHSLGASLALISAYDLAEMRVNTIQSGQASRGEAQFYNTIPITVFAFSGPRVGNLKFKERCDELGIRVLRVNNKHDKVPTVPGIIANEKMQFQKYVEETLAFPWSYAHVGVELALDHRHSPFLKDTRDLGCAHNLEALLHLVDGYHGKERPFRMVEERDVALVNKSCNFLKSEYGVPPNWRQDENKGMVRSADGRWVVPERPKVEGHPEDTAHLLEQVLKIATSQELQTDISCCSLPQNEQ